MADFTLLDIVSAYMVGLCANLDTTYMVGLYDFVTAYMVGWTLEK